MRIFDFHTILSGTPVGEIEQHIQELTVALQAESDPDDIESYRSLLIDAKLKLIYDGFMVTAKDGSRYVREGWDYDEALAQVLSEIDDK